MKTDFDRFRSIVEHPAFSGMLVGSDDPTLDSAIVFAKQGVDQLGAVLTVAAFIVAIGGLDAMQLFIQLTGQLERPVVAMLAIVEAEEALTPELVEKIDKGKAS